MKKTYRKLADDLAADRSHGASELARLALLAVERFAAEYQTQTNTGLSKAILEFIDELMRSRPSMAPVWNMLQQVKSEILESRQASIDLLREKIKKAANTISQDSVTAVFKAAENAESLISPGQTIMTHSYSSTVMALFERLSKKHVSAIITESRPLYEGRKMAEHTAGVQIPVQLITDAQIGIFVDQADMVIVGADSIMPDGSLVNKAGTYLLALACQAERVPFHVCCESFKVRGPQMPPLKLEKMDPEELGFSPHQHITINNTYFELTPARFVTSWISESGIKSNWS